MRQLTLPAFGLFLIFQLLISCSFEKTEVDMLLINGQVYTVDSTFTIVSAFAVDKGKIVDVGTSEEITASYFAGQVIDANGRTVIPGIIDAHCHFYRLGLNEQYVDLAGTRSFSEILERVQEFAKEHNPSVILGRGWDQNDWEIKEYPDREALDSMFPNTPVVLTRIDGHALLANQAALDLAGVRAGDRVSGGEIIQQGGRLTGILIDKPMERIWAALPATDKDTKIQALLEAQRICVNNGLTTVNDAGLDRDIIDLIDSLQQAGELKIRVYAMISNSSENLDHYLESDIIKTERLHVGSVKVYADGALGSRGAALKAPYTDQPSHYGAMVTPVSEIKGLSERLARTRFQMNTHAIGDSANAVVLSAYESALPQGEDRRWKIEHAQVLDTADIPRLNKNIIPSVQPTHATSDMYWAEERLGEGRMKGAYAYKSLLQASGLIALGTDFPVEEVNPFLTFYAAVARKDTAHFPEGGFLSEESLNREQALRGMTIWAAYSNFEEGEKGSIEKGKWADFVILSDDIMQVPEAKLPTLKALEVYIAGEHVN